MIIHPFLYIAAISLLLSQLIYLFDSGKEHTLMIMKMLLGRKLIRREF
jgi:hypothetical protein